MRIIGAAMSSGALSTADGSAVWLDASTRAADDADGLFRQVGGGCVFHVGPPAAAGGAARHCAVHARLGHAALPAACQHFPRVCLIDDRGVRVSLSHYCPTAAALLIDHEGPVAVVAGPAPVAERAVPEGLDVRGELPPRLNDRVLTDLDGATAWERRLVAVLAGGGATGSPEAVLARVREEARRLSAWTPGSGVSLTQAVAALDVFDQAALDAESLVLANPASWPPWFDLAASACRRPWVPGAAPADLAALDARFVAPGWDGHAAAVRRYLAARAFGAWIVYQADAVRALAAWLTLCHAVLRIECARACAATARPLDRQGLVTAIRQSDLLLVHYAGALAIARALGHGPGTTRRRLASAAAPARYAPGMLRDGA
jgi:hypothetical protein